jgi:hypothetical protein
MTVKPKEPEKMEVKKKSKNVQKSLNNLEEEFELNLPEPKKLAFSKVLKPKNNLGNKPGKLSAISEKNEKSEKSVNENVPKAKELKAEKKATPSEVPKVLKPKPRTKKE